ncbi:hypothetical protein OG462_07400 [Streptomyces sp. NBC_01077]|uniref:hypothetical protein n=1 Tax=Streptomyces sp. NBC_01077 TaxID=2903746 RepID=UPI003863A71C|nr:hypothetical protein OG462_07400 [Streptomyces sp. NBC_01077]
MPNSDETHRFTALSARLTGFDRADLDATGLTEVYRAVAAERLGTRRYARLLQETGEDEGGALEGDLRTAARAVTYLWYTGSWPGPSPFVVSPRAYAEGLMWKAAGLRAPATGPGGYGSWAEAHDRSGPGSAVDRSGPGGAVSRSGPGGAADRSGPGGAVEWSGP